MGELARARAARAHGLSRGRDDAGQRSQSAGAGPLSRHERWPVTSIRLDPADRHKVLIDVEVDSDLPVTRGTRAARMEGITGIAYVHLLDDSHETAPPPKGRERLAELR